MSIYIQSEHVTDKPQWVGIDGHHRYKVAAASLGVILAATGVFAQTPPATSGTAEDGTPDWFLQGSFPYPGGNTSVDAEGMVTILPRTGRGARPAMC